MELLMTSELICTHGITLNTCHVYVQNIYPLMMLLWYCAGGISACINQNPGARGLAVIVTNEYEGTTDALPGTREDAKSLLETFKFAQFIVCCKHCATGDELLHLVEEVQSLKAEQVKNYECILCAFSGHGDEDDWICMEDDAYIHVLDQVRDPLLAESAPGLAGIPKVILSDACRGEEETRTTEVPAKKQRSSTNKKVRKKDLVPSKGNYLVACATMAEHCAYMRPYNLGSAWTQILAAELKTNEGDLEGVLTDVNTKMMEKAQRAQIEFQQPEKRALLNRRVYIHPAHSKQPANRD